MVNKMNECKISLYNNYRCLIENYRLIKKIELNEIIIDNYIVKGNNLKIKRMNDYVIEIIGKVNLITIGDFHEV